MKTMLILLMLCFLGNVQAQDVIQLGEAKVSYSPEMKLTNNNDLKINVKEKYRGEFSQNAIKFMEDNFNIHEIISSVDPGTYDQYDVIFKSRNGYLKAIFDGEGDLLTTTQKFDNIKLPTQMVKDLYQNYKGYNMVKNKYVARGKGNLINKQHYLITLHNGDDKKRIKLVPAVNATGNVATNY